MIHQAAPARQPLLQVADSLGEMTTAHVILFALFFLVSIVGGNAVFLMHNRRTGRSWRALFDMTSFPLLHFNRKEWFLLAVVSLTAFLVGGSVWLL